MKTIIILGGTGLVGHALYAGLSKTFHAVATVRDDARHGAFRKKFPLHKKSEIAFFDAERFMYDYYFSQDHENVYKDFFQMLQDADCVINAIGITPALAQIDRKKTFFINSMLPHILSGFLKDKLIHISTDCVFDGIRGHPYTEESPTSPVDYYGFSKSIGEPPQSLTIRTSFIGREIDSCRGLLEWSLRQKGKTIEGYPRCIWSGVTTGEFARICADIIENRDAFLKHGVLHLFSPAVSKYEMLKMFREKFDIDCEIRENTAKKVNRSLSSIYDYCARLQVPSLPEMLAAMPNDIS